MDTLLKTYFPIIRTREEVLDLIGEKEKLTDLFESWSEEQQEEFLDFCTGAKGVKMLYDSFFKEIFNPEYHAGRLEELLSLLLETKIRIKQILPNDSVRLADEYTLLITDIVIETEDWLCISGPADSMLFRRPAAQTVQESEGQETERKQKI